MKRLDTKHAFSPVTIRAINHLAKVARHTQTWLALLLALFAGFVIFGCSIAVFFVFSFANALGGLSCGDGQVSQWCEMNREVFFGLWMIPAVGTVLALVAMWGIFVSMKHRNLP
jgi:hypothetical protein